MQCRCDVASLTERRGACDVTVGGFVDERLKEQQVFLYITELFPPLQQQIHYIGAQRLLKKNRRRIGSISDLFAERIDGNSHFFRPERSSVVEENSSHCPNFYIYILPVYCVLQIDLKWKENSLLLISLMPPPRPLRMKTAGIMR